MLIKKNEKKDGPKRSLILAGGGIRVAYQAGILMALEESGLEFHHVDGTSGGIFNTAMLACGKSANEIANNWRSLKIKYFASAKRFKEYLTPHRMQGFGDADNIRKKVFPHFGIEMQAIRDSPFTATFNVCNFTDKTIEALGSEIVEEDHLIAGVSLPVLMPALRVGKDWYTDAVWIKDANLMEGVKRGSNELWLIWAIGNSPTYFSGAFHQYVHMIEMSANGALLEEFQQIKTINKYSQKDPEIERNETIKLFVIKPPISLPLDPDLFFNRINARELINMGYEDGKNYLNKEPSIGETMDKDATKSLDPGNQLCFRGTFKGKMAWDSHLSEISYFTYFRFRNSGLERDTLDLFSSIYIDVIKEEIPLFLHVVKIKDMADGCILEAQAKMLVRGEVFDVHSSWKLKTPLYWMFGLDFKAVKLEIQRASDPDLVPVISGKLYQSFWDRIKSGYFSFVKTKEGRRGGIRIRYKLISKLMEYEI